MEKPITAVIVERGTYTFGHSFINPDGTTEKIPAKFVADAEGGSVVVSAFDTEKCKPIGEAELLPHYDTVEIEKCISEKLNLSRRNFPAPEEIYRWIKKWDGRGIDFCEICEGIFAGYDCDVCPIQAMKYEQEGLG